MGSARNCLNLAGDGDDVDLLCAVETAFAVKLTDAEARQCETVGQLYDIVGSKLIVSDARGLRCPTALAFFRLRAGLRRLGCSQTMKTKTELPSLLRGRAGRDCRCWLEAETGLKLPSTILHDWGLGVLIVILAAGVMAAFGIRSWAPCVASIGAALVIVRWLPQSLRAENLGQLAVACTARNYGRLSAACGGARPADLWKALTCIVQDETGFTDAIDRDTRFFSR